MHCSLAAERKALLETASRLSAKPLEKPSGKPTTLRALEERMRRSTSDDVLITAAQRASLRRSSSQDITPLPRAAKETESETPGKSGNNREGPSKGPRPKFKHPSLLEKQMRMAGRLKEARRSKSYTKERLGEAERALARMGGRFDVLDVKGAGWQTIGSPRSLAALRRARAAQEAASEEEATATTVSSSGGPAVPAKPKLRSSAEKRHSAEESSPRSASYGSPRTNAVVQDVQRQERPKPDEVGRVGCCVCLVLIACVHYDAIAEVASTNTLKLRRRWSAFPLFVRSVAKTALFLQTVRWC